MCGFFTIYNLRRGTVLPETIEKGLDAIVHRGPDDSGIHVEGNIGMGLRRLSIIDVAGGRQPISNEDDSIWMVFNGEIYNYKELRENLVLKGHKFKTNSDTEVILHLYEESPEEFISELNGMFSFVIWDRKKNKIVAARDRIGIKPFFYSLDNERLILSSEIKSFFTLEGFSRSIDTAALEDYFSFYYIPSPKTIYSSVRRLQPGNMLIYENNSLKIKKYWDFRIKDNELLDEQSIIELIPEVLERSVKRHLQSEVPLGMFLSSGLDSTSILAVLSRLKSNVRTYTVGYENQESYNEIESSRKVAEMYGAQHTSCILSPDDISSILPKVIGKLDEPQGDWSHLAFYYVSENSKNDLTVVLNGAGGDELFGGYPTLIAAKAAKFYKYIPEIVRKNIIKNLVEYFPESYKYLSFSQKLKLFIKGADLDFEHAHQRYKEIFDSNERNQYLYTDASRDIFKEGYDTFDNYRQYLKGFNASDILDRLMYMDLKVFHPDCTLNVSDITTMANSQECRLPMLDLEMIELAQKIPADLKCRKLTTKYVFRKAMEKMLPANILKMKKKGFTIPTDPWLREEKLYKYVKNIINESESRNKWLNYAYLNNLVDDHYNGKKNNTRKITAIVSFIVWQNLNKISL